MKKLYYGIGIFLILVICATILQVTIDHTEIQKLKREFQLIQKDKQPKPPSRVSIADKPPPANETHETGHWHGNQWHRTTPANATTDNPNANETTYIDIPVTTAQTDWNSLIPKRENYESDEKYIKDLDTTATELNKTAIALANSNPDTSIKLSLIANDLIDKSQQLKQAHWKTFTEQFPLNKEPPTNAQNPLIDQPPAPDTQTQ